MSFTFEDKQDFPNLLFQTLSESQRPRAVPLPVTDPVLILDTCRPLLPRHAHTHTITCACSQFAQQIAGMRFCEASAKDNFNVDEIFLKLVDDILKKVKKKNPVS